MTPEEVAERLAARKRTMKRSLLPLMLGASILAFLTADKLDSPAYVCGPLALVTVGLFVAEFNRN